MKIAHYYADLFDTGGCPWNLRSLATAQVALGHEVSGFGFTNPRGNEPCPAGMRCTEATRGPRGLRVLIRGIRELHPDVLQVWTALIPGNELVLRAAHRAGITTVLTPQGHLEPFLFSWGRSVSRRLGKRVYREVAIKPMLRRWVDVLHAQSPYEERLARLLGLGGASRIFPLGVPVDEVPPTERPGPLRDMIGVSSDQLVAGFFGRFDPVQKRFDALFEALASCRDLSDDGTVCFVLAGKATDRQQRETAQLLTRHGLHDVVRVAGPFNGSDRFRALADLDLLLHPTRYEGLPRVIREAAAVGTPAIVSLQTNAESLVEAGGARLTDPAPSAIARSIRSAVTDEDWRQSASGAAKAWAHANDWEACARNFDVAYELGISRRRPAPRPGA